MVPSLPKRCYPKRECCDAAVATAFTLAVTYPEAGNIGGGGFMTLWIEGKPYFLDYREVAPSKADKDMFLDG